MTDFRVEKSIPVPPSLRYEKECRRAYASIRRLIDRAKASGLLREDFVAEDIVLLLSAHAGSSRLRAVWPGDCPRLPAYLLEAFAASGERTLPPPPSEAMTYRALLALGDHDREAELTASPDQGIGFRPSDRSPAG